MAKSRSKRRKAPKTHKTAKSGGAGTTAKSAAIPWGGKSGSGTRQINIIIAVALVVALAAGGIYYGRAFLTGQDFKALAAEGQDRLSDIEPQADHGGGHLSPGETYVYSESIPTSGRHDPSPLPPGFYKTQQRQTRLVHSLEHGNVVIYYGRLSSEASETVNKWVGLYGGSWDGVIAAPLPGLGEKIVLAAWNNMLRLDGFEPAAAAAFIDKFRGRGPENPVR